jgi:methylthioribose-1-phosphate isomerase
MAAPPRLQPAVPLRWDGERLHVLDQTRLPAEEVVLELTGAADTAAAIRRLAVRGAPLIGVAAAYGLAMEVARVPTREAMERAATLIDGARPTARNLAWAVERVRDAALAADDLATGAREAAEAIERADAEASAALARHGADALAAALGERPVTLMTHCNSGALAASGRGTGLGVIAELADRREVRVLACEARPLLQGARLTVWELGRLGIPHDLLVDAAAPGLIRTGQVDAVVTGFDRVAANGDVANKVGTYPLAVMAARHGVPFYVAAPVSTIDRSTLNGAEIPIEERDPAEVTADDEAFNPAFDVTPAGLVTAIFTEVGVLEPPYERSIGRL